jgi:hypothetical protein
MCFLNSEFYAKLSFFVIRRMYVPVWVRMKIKCISPCLFLVLNSFRRDNRMMKQAKREAKRQEAAYNRTKMIALEPLDVFVEVTSRLATSMQKTASTFLASPPQRSPAQRLTPETNDILVDTMYLY